MSTIDIHKRRSTKKDEIMIPFTQLYLSSCSKDSNGKVLLSPQLMSEYEVDDFVDNFIRQLEKKRKEAKDELNKQNDIMKNKE